MDSFGSKSKIGKRFSINNKMASEEKMENIKHELDELTKSIGTTKKAKEDDKAFVFSLSHFEEKNRSSRGSNSINETLDTPPETEKVDQTSK